MTPLWVAQVSLDGNMERNKTNQFLKVHGPKQELPLLVSVAETLNVYYVPFLLTVGLSLHCLCCLCFTKTSMYKKFFTQLFLAISVADIGFLLTLLLMWLRDLNLDIYAAPGMCPMVIFMSHFFPFLSFWNSIIAVVIVLLQPYEGHVNKFARGQGRGRITVICSTIFTFTVYLYKTWTNGVLKIKGVRYCTVLLETRDAMKVLNIFDVMFLLLIPFLGFIFFGCVVIIRHLNINSVCKRRQGPHLSVTKDAMKVLIAHAICFIVFVGPGCLSKVYFYIKGGPGSSEAQIRDLLLQNLFQYLFYTYFCVTPLLHIIFSSSFRSHVRIYLASTKEQRNIVHIEHIFQEEPHSEQTLL